MWIGIHSCSVPLGGGVELLLVVAVLGGERDGGERERERGRRGRAARFTRSPPRRSTSTSDDRELDRERERVDHGRGQTDALVRDRDVTSGMPTSSRPKLVPMPRIPAAARLSVPSGRRVSSSAKSWPATQSVAASSPAPEAASRRPRTPAARARSPRSPRARERGAREPGAGSRRPARSRSGARVDVVDDGDRERDARRSRRSGGRAPPSRAATRRGRRPPSQRPVVPSRRPDAVASECGEDDAAAPSRTGAYHPACNSPIAAAEPESAKFVTCRHGDRRGSSSSTGASSEGARPGASSVARSPTRPSSSSSSDPVSRPGRSRRWTSSAHAAWVAERVRAGDHLVGHSYGGVIALLAAARGGGRLASLTVIEPPCTRVALDDPVVAEFARRGAELYASGAHLDPETFLRTFLAAVGSDFDPPSPLPAGARAGRAGAGPRARAVGGGDPARGRSRRSGSPRSSSRARTIPRSTRSATSSSASSAPSDSSSRATATTRSSPRRSPTRCSTSSRVPTGCPTEVGHLHLRRRA